jgi:Rrf2 family protein
MRVSMKTEYGVRALVDLAMHYGKGPLANQTIAARHSIPSPFLDQVMAALRRAGLIRSVRGPLGGHTLNRKPQDLRLIEVVRALEGSLAPIACLDDPLSCPMRGQCTVMPVWRQVEHATARVLENITIADLADREVANIPARYSI